MTTSGTVSIGERGEVRRTISPYDLTAADNPGAVISYPLLRGSNYDEWPVSIKTALCSRKKIGFVDDTITKPADGTQDAEDWDPVNALLVSWIKMTIHESIRSNISHREVAKDLWDYLKKRYSVSSGPKLQQLKYEMANCRQLGSPVEIYYGKLNKMMCFYSMKPVRRCKCSNCTCDVTTLQEQDLDEDKVQQFLYGLDDKYQSIRSNITSRVPISSLEEAYNMVRQEVDLLSHSATREEQVEVVALAAQTQPRNRDEKSSRVTCRIYKRTGHTSDRCYSVVGSPEWRGDRPKLTPHL